jgi:MYXO-CTERM domain-containing protein
MPSDFNEDGFVDGDDLEEWQTAFRQTAQGDADGDGDTDGADFLSWQRQINGAASAMAASSTVPEPTTLWGAWVTAGLVGAVMHRRRR